MAKEVVETAGGKGACKYNACVDCSEHKCKSCGFNPAVKIKRLNRLKYARLGLGGMRLIDANALRDKERGTLRWLSGLDLDAAPTIDAVCVIRCADCVECVEKVMFSGKIIYECRNTELAVSLDDYCSMAKRRASNDN